MHTCKYTQAYVHLHKYSYKQTGSRSPKSSCPCRGYVCVSVSPKAFLLSHLPKHSVSNCCAKRKHICLDFHRIALCITTATWKKRPHKDLDSSHLAEMSERKGGQLLWSPAWSKVGNSQQTEQSPACTTCSGDEKELPKVSAKAPGNVNIFTFPMGIYSWPRCTLFDLPPALSSNLNHSPSSHPACIYEE